MTSDRSQSPAGSVPNFGQPTDREYADTLRAQQLALRIEAGSSGLVALIEAQRSPWLAERVAHQLQRPDGPLAQLQDALDQLHAAAAPVRPRKRRASR